MFTMSHRRPSKRSRNVLNDVADESSPSSPSMRYSQPKRPKHEENFDLQETSVRRSSRAPKPKVFDDDYKDSRSPVVEPVERKETTGTHRNQPERRSLDDSVDIVDDSGQDFVRRSSRVPKPKILDEDYFESSKMKSEIRSLERESDEKTFKVLPHAPKTKTLHVPENTPHGSTVKQHHVQRSEEHKKEKHRKHRYSVEDARLDSVAIGNKKPVSEDQKSRKTGLHVHQKDLSGSSSQGSPKSGAELFVSDNFGTPKVRTSSRTPVPKKTFALIDDSLVSRTAEGLSEEEGNGIEVDSIPHISHKHSNKHSKQTSLTQSLGDALQALSGGLQGAQPTNKRRGNSWGEAGYDEVHNMKSKPNKSKEEHAHVAKEFLVAPAVKLSEASTGRLGEGHKIKGKEKGKKHSTKGVSQAEDSRFNEKKTEMEKKENGKQKKVEIIDEQLQAKRKPKKKKVDYAVEKAELQSTCTPVSMKNRKGQTSEKSHSKHSTSSHGKKATKHSKHIDEPHSETKDEDEHIILKLHLPHAEGSSHSHSHKKHKHKHSSESKSEATGSDNKAKRQKLSFEGASSSSEEKHKQKKLSIKFKGLSGSTPGVEVDVQGSKSVLKTTKEKAVKSDSVHVGKKKKPKKPSVEELTSPPKEQEHLKMVIKKNKKEVKKLQSDSEKSVTKTLSKEAKSKPKVNSKPEKIEKGKSLKVTPKKKSKVSESPKLGEKEKRKIVSGYLLFCKKQRSKIYEANPGLEFAQISQKVGEAWNKLPASTKQEWKDKAKAVKDKIMLEEEERRQEAVKTGPDAVDMAAHLKLLGESLSVIGGSLMAQRETEVHGSLSVLLDSILCAICPLTFLTSHIPGIPGIAKEKQEQILDDLAYTMPGLG